MESRFTGLLSDWLNDIWYSSNVKWPLLPLLPLSWLVKIIALRRYRTYQVAKKKQWKPPVPVIVVGNITVGGAGKTPLVLALVKKLKEAGYNAGIVSRGYGGKSTQFPRLVTISTNTKLVGDEAVMLAQQVKGIPIVICKNRQNAVKFLLEYDENCSVIVSDDGMQHPHLWRDIEIAVLDGTRMFGNKQCLPAGPLRESIDRLKTVDAIVANGSLKSALNYEFNHMQLIPVKLINIANRKTIAIENILSLGETVHAVAGIGHPKRFFRQLEFLGFKIVPHSFADHHKFSVSDFEFCKIKPLPVIMTSKDAVKCTQFARENWWMLEVEADVPEAFWNIIFKKIERVMEKRKQDKKLIK